MLAISGYLNTWYSVTKDQEGNYYMDNPYAEECIIIYPEEVVVKNESGDIVEEEPCKTVQISESLFFAYYEGTDAFGESEIQAYVIAETDDGYTCYLTDMEGPMLFYDGTIIFKESNEEEEYNYMLSDGNLYVIGEEEYTGGVITPCGTEAFLWEVSNKELFFKSAEGSSYLLFVRASLIEQDD